MKLKYLSERQFFGLTTLFCVSLTSKWAGFIKFIFKLLAHCNVFIGLKTFRIQRKMLVNRSKPYTNEVVSVFLLPFPPKNKATVQFKKYRISYIMEFDAWKTRKAKFQMWVHLYHQNMYLLWILDLYRHSYTDCIYNDKDFKPIYKKYDRRNVILFAKYKMWTIKIIELKVDLHPTHFL